MLAYEEQVPPPTVEQEPISARARGAGGGLVTGLRGDDVGGSLQGRLPLEGIHLFFQKCSVWGLCMVNGVEL
jgi:hypothetical protein